MIKINYKEPESSETLDDIAKYNIKICDKYKKADYMELSCISWLKIDSTRDYQNLEQLLRELDLDSYVIAQQISHVPIGLEINYPNENKIIEPLEYIAKITCRTKEDSLKELLMYHTTYEENYEYLKKTGCLVEKKKEKNKEEEEKISQVKGINEVKKLLDCSLKLDLEYYKSIESINYIIEDLTKIHGKKPEKIICGEINENKVYALSLNNEIISPIGWIEKPLYQSKIINIVNEQNYDSKKEKENDIEYELIDFRKIKMEKA
jgi:hypothetical protein